MGGGAGRATSGLHGPTDRATFGLRAEVAAHGPPGHRTGPPVTRKVRIGPAQLPGRFTGHGPGRGSRAIWPPIYAGVAKPAVGRASPVPRLRAPPIPWH
jgi:hypothetical protein